MKLVVALCFIGLIVAAEAVTEGTLQQKPHRKLAQRGYYRGRRFDPDQQFARNQAAAINTQGAIRAAQASGANPYATRGAANVGSANAFLAAQRSDLVYGPWGH